MYVEASRDADYNVCITRKGSSNNTVLRKTEIPSAEENINDTKQANNKQITSKTTPEPNHIILIQFGDNEGLAKDINYTCLVSF